MNNSGKPVYKELIDFYKTKIINQELSPDSKMDSIVRIMSRHNVSRDTAKRVINDLSKEGYVRKIVGKGTFITSARKVKKIWGMVIPFYSSNINELMSNLQVHAQQAGCEFIYFLTYNNHEEEKRLVTEMVMQGYKAVILVPNNDETKTAEYYRRLIPGNTTIVLVDNTMAGSYFKYVIQSYDLGVARALKYLSDQNDGNMLLIKNEDWQGRNLLYELMERTFCDIVNSIYPSRNPFVLNNVHSLTIGLIKNNKIGGILCCTDTDSIRALGRIKKWNLNMPGEISLVSYGNTELTEYFEPPITSLDCQYPEMAEMTAQLISKGKQSGIYEQHIINPKIIIRKT
jgi:GntR family transcriptional regulator of arabinose operon